jgi:hypothetical protein
MILTDSLFPRTQRTEDPEGQNPRGLGQAKMRLVRGPQYALVI